MKALRYLAIAVVVIVLLLVAALVAVTTILDPNDFKPQIEKAAEDNTNLDLILDGDISWSFIPIGLELNKVEARLEDKKLVSMDKLVAQVDFWSLLKMSPAVDTFVLDGLDARLVKNAEGQGNWERIMPEGESQTEEPEQKKEEPQQETTQESGDSTPLAFNVEKVKVSNAQVHYTDEATGQSVTLENVSLDSSDITLGEFFPLQLGFRFATNKPDFTVDGKLSAKISANEALNNFQVKDIDSSFDLTGEPFKGETVNAGLSGSLAANLEDETASLSDIAINFANVNITTNLDVADLGDKPKLDGKLAVEGFSVRKLLAAMGRPDIETSDPDVLANAAFSTAIGGKPGQIDLNDIKLILDDTTFKGQFGLGLANTAIALKLNGDSLNVDRYLPPKSEASSGDSKGNDKSNDDTGQADSAKTASSENSGQAAEESDLLPLETLRGLALDINFGLKELVASNLTINDIKSTVTADKGLIKVKEVSGKLYYGDFDLSATLDARSDNPTWKIKERANGIETLPLLTDLADVKMLSGAVNLTADITTQGNRISKLRENAKGQVDFNLAKGKFRNINLTQMACQGIALANQDSLSKNDWNDETPFDDMSGTLKIDGNTLTNTNLTAALAGMDLSGDGDINMATNKLDYEAGLRIVGEVAKDEACRTTEYVKGVVIPLECRGDLSGDPAKLCSFDGSRFRDTLKDMAKNAASKKAKKEINRAIDDKVGEKLDGKLDKDSSKKVKDALKGLFN